MDTVSSFTEELDRFEAPPALEILRSRVRLRVYETVRRRPWWLGGASTHVITVTGPAQAVEDAKREMQAYLDRDRAERSVW